MCHVPLASAELAERVKVWRTGNQGRCLRWLSDAFANVWRCIPSGDTSNPGLPLKWSALELLLPLALCLWRSDIHIRVHKRRSAKHGAVRMQLWQLLSTETKKEKPLKLLPFCHSLFAACQRLANASVSAAEQKPGITFQPFILGSP